MTIEFHCPECNKVLRTTKAKAGAKSSCPACGSDVTVPGVALESIDLTIDDIEDDDIYEQEISQKNDDRTDVGHSPQAYQDDSEKDYEEASEKTYDEGDPYSEMIDEESPHHKKNRNPSTSSKGDFDSVFPTPARDFVEVDKNIDFYEEEEIDHPASYRRRKDCPMCGATILASVRECPRCGETISSRRSSQFKQNYIPHRGGLILGLGIASFFTCCIFLGVASWVMGNQDLAELDAGRMDPAGRELTQIGQILGMISVVLQAGMVLFFCCLGIVSGA